LEAYRTDDAEIIMVSAGTTTSVARLTVDQMRRSGKKVGLMRIRLFRPVPAHRWREVLRGAQRVVVIDRNLSPGLGGILASEVQAALYLLARRPLVYSIVAGLGGRDVTPADVRGMIGFVESPGTTAGAPLFWGWKQ
jgi:pyruvate/2-oxoacid:ferredoxin oxidoreductase alpha subunit